MVEGNGLLADGVCFLVEVAVFEVAGFVVEVVPDDFVDLGRIEGVVEAGSAGAGLFEGQEAIMGWL